VLAAVAIASLQPGLVALKTLDPDHQVFLVGVAYNADVYHVGLVLLAVAATAGVYALSGRLGAPTRPRNGRAPLAWRPDGAHQRRGARAGAFCGGVTVATRHRARRRVRSDRPCRAVRPHPVRSSDPHGFVPARARREREEHPSRAALGFLVPSLAFLAGSPGWLVSGVAAALASA
jgi:hypothetical protein